MRWHPYRRRSHLRHESRRQFAENIGNFWVQIHAKWTGELVVERAVEDEKSAAIEWCMDGEHQGNKFEVCEAHYQFHDTLIAEIRQYGF